MASGRRKRTQRQFPLADWIEEHRDARYSLGSSGMRDVLPSTARHLERGPERPPDDEALREELGRRLGVDGGRVLLTHGATESNGLVLSYLARTLTRELGRPPTIQAPRPEYPPLVDAARFAGFVDASGEKADLLARSNPHNPTGEYLDPGQLEARFAASTHWLLDETFREFTSAGSFAALDRPATWVTGTLTKAFGADAVRLGWVVPPPEEVEAFRTVHGLFTDEIPDASVGLARDLLADASTILRETRSIFQRNRLVLQRGLPGIGHPAAPVAFDRPGPADAEPLALAALSDGILTCPGRFFDDPSGLRIGFTRPDFPDAFARYLATRSRFLDARPSRTSAPATPRPSPGARAAGAPTAPRAPTPRGRRAP